LVASNVPEARGLVAAKRLGIPIWAQSHKGMERADFDRLLDAELRRHGVELVALAGYMRLLSPEFIRAWQGRILNIHPSLLPAYKGLDTHRRAIDAGEAEAGCSVHLVTEELDAGEVLGQVSIPILRDDTAGALEQRVLAAEHQLYPQVLNEFALR
jgi:formyltetrahydrofolate-dependent phosphoribosylglycinamide formyltransferase